MKKVFFFVSVIGSLLLTAPSNAQCLDKVGFSAGYTHSTMRWNVLSGFSKPFVSGISVMGFAEKSVNKTWGIRSQFGYITQGYGSSDHIYISHHIHPVSNLEGFRFHQLALDLSAKVNLSRGCLNPYLTAGIRSHYAMAFQNLNPVSSMEGYRTLMPSDFTRFSGGATLGIGMEICHAFFIEAEYSPSLSNSIRYNSYRGRNHSYGIKAGYFLFNSKRSCAEIKNPLQRSNVDF